MFHPVKAPAAKRLFTLLHQIIQRIMQFMTRRAPLVKEQGTSCLAGTETDTAMAPLITAACTYRIAMG